MKDDGARLSYVIRGCSYKILDNTNGQYCIFNLGETPIVTMDKKLAIDHLETLTYLLNSVQRKSTGLFPVHRKHRTGEIKITEISHYNYEIVIDDCITCTLTDKFFTAPKGIEIIDILRNVNYVWSSLLQLKVTLNPSRNIVRRIADVGVLVWVYRGQSIVCYENNICGSIMLNCMVNGEHYKQIYVSLNKEENLCELFDSNLQLICELPIDESILAYYSYDADAFSEGE